MGINDETEWKYIGEGSTFELELAQKLIDEHLSGETVYIINGRHNSASIRKSKAAEEVAKALKERNILLCDFSFNAFVEFNHIGTIRYGARNS